MTLYTAGYFSPVVPDVGVGPPPKSHKINQGGRDMIDGAGKKQKLFSCTRLYLSLLNFSLILAFLENG